MSWQLYRWVWQVESPLHIGAPPAGALNRTRLYVPARALWGAITAEIARCRSQNQFPDYEPIGRHIQSNVRLSYLFPAEQVNSQWRAWVPRYRDGQGLVWEREEDHQAMEDRRFRMRLLITRPGTAIAPESDTAAEGTLREFELINSYWREESEWFKPVAMVGYLFCKDAALCAEICQVEELFVGGDTRYGLGHLTRIACELVSQFFDGIQVDLQADPPTVTTTRVLAHASIRGGQRPVGAMECLGGWDLVQGGLRRAELVWAPGSCFDQNQFFKLQEDGLWQM
ncbi:MAG TPA: hypothetical protein VNM72_13325 [Blastocatellia bacterium]|nr:hypothetical protein [Blastocatellia bacterium]